MTKGGYRPNSGRKKLPDNIKKHKVNFYITFEEKEYLKKVLEERRKTSTWQKTMLGLW